MNDFLYGYANSSLQYEGLEGRSRTIWDDFCDTPRKIKGKGKIDIACDGFHRWEEDIDLLAEYGIPAYRISISWARVMTGPVTPSSEGIEYYKKIIDYCHEKGIKVFATLYHWELPTFIQEKGGWRDRNIASYFSAYAGVCASCLSPDAWITINEPWCIAYLGHYYGSHAPGLKLSPEEMMEVVHNINLAHGSAVKLLKEHLNIKTPVGIAFNPYFAQNPKESVQELAFDFETRIFTDPIFHGRYPQSVIDRGYEPKNINKEVDMQIISTPIDFYGINYYFENNCKTKRKFPFSQLNNDPNDGVPRNMLGWRIVPEGLLRILRKMNEESGGLPVYITENGYPDEGTFQDIERWNYVIEHIHICERAVEEGIPLKGYFQWSITDNFEWQNGYKPRFGGIHVDFETQERTPKVSMHLYSRYIKEEGNGSE